ncbi:DUF1566 domain-containing protein [Stagnimonas aquatica]|nr:DUF1566 domain-containing protein [Stagnimonas aquatica]
MPVSKFHRTLLTALLLGLGLSAGAQAQQVCNASLAATRPDSQYRISADGSEVTDLTTGLIWKRCVEGQNWDADNQQCSGTPTAMAWPAALVHVSAQTGGWRLPNLNEALSLLEAGCKTPAHNVSVFPSPTTASQLYHLSTSTPHADSDGDRWVIDFQAGVDRQSTKRVATSLLRLVREPQP